MMNHQYREAKLIYLMYNPWYVTCDCISIDVEEEYSEISQVLYDLQDTIVAIESQLMRMDVLS